MADPQVLVITQYVEPGRSATSIDKRPVFQALLERLRGQRDVDYVIIYKLSRLNRNRIDTSPETPSTTVPRTPESP